MKKAFALVGVLAGIILLIVGLGTKVPERVLSSFGENEVPTYIKGDAYNYQIESAIKGGEIAGANAAKAIYISGGCILIFLSAFSFASAADEAKKPVPNAAAVSYMQAPPPPSPQPTQQLR